MPARQRILLIVFLIGLMAYLGHWGYQTLIVGPLEEKQREIDRARKGAQDDRREVTELRDAKDELERWKELSLTDDPNAATAQYQAFLLDLLGKWDFERPTISAGAPSVRDESYWRIPFTVEAQGPLSSVLALLEGFSRTGLLHRLNNISMTPAGGEQGDLMDLRFQVEALALLSDADRERAGRGPLSRGIASDGTGRLPLDRLLDQNLLMRQGPGRSPSPAHRASQVYLTGTVIAGRRPEALLYDRAAGESIVLHLGDALAVGDVRGELVDVSLSEVVLDVGGQWCTVALGDHLGQRRPLSAEDALAREIQLSQSASKAPLEEE